MSVLEYWVELREAKTWAIALEETLLKAEPLSPEIACAEDFLYAINHDHEYSEDYLYYIQKMSDADYGHGKPPYTFWRYRMQGMCFDMQIIKNRKWVSIEGDRVLSSHREIASLEDIDEQEYMNILYGDERNQ